MVCVMCWVMFLCRWLVRCLVLFIRCWLSVLCRVGLFCSDCLIVVRLWCRWLVSVEFLLVRFLCRLVWMCVYRFCI